jgi:CRP-like cAMP-binding protein
VDDFLQIRHAICKLLPLGEPEWIAFAGQLQLKKFKKGEYLVENHIFFINRGMARSYFLKDDKGFTVDFQLEGEFVTAYFSFITQEPSAMFIELMENTDAVVIAYKSLHQLYNQYHSIEKIGRLIAETQYVKRLRKEMEFLSYTAEERYARLMERNPQIIQNISVKHLSSYLGIRPESLSRIRKLHSRT